MVGNGRAVATWYTSTHLVVARRVPGVGWLPPRRLAARPELGFEERPTVAMNERGGIVVVYQDRHRIRAIRRPASGTWLEPRTLIRTRSPIAVPEVSIGPRGTATVVVGKDPNNDGALTMLAIRSRPGGWTRPHRLGLGDYPAVVTGPHGHVTAAWWCNFEICVRERDSGGWGALHRMLPDSSAELSLAVDGTGRVFLSTVDAVLSHRPGRKWRPERAVPDGGWYDSAIAAAGDGRAAVVFTGPGSDGVPFEVVASVRRPGGAWTRPHLIPRQSGAGSAVSAAIARDGTAFVSVNEVFDTSDVDVARFVPGTGWADVVTIARGTEGTVVCGPDGNAAVLFNGRSYRLKASFRPAN